MIYIYKLGAAQLSSNPTVDLLKGMLTRALLGQNSLSNPNRSPSFSVLRFWSVFEKETGSVT